MSLFAKILGFFMSLAMMAVGSLAPDAKVDTPSYEAVFAEMLGANYACESDFLSQDDLFISSLVALRENADGEGYIERKLIDDYMFNMYGIDSSKINLQTPGMVEEKCFILIPPMGYDVLEYDIISVEKTENGYAAEITITVNPHDTSEYVLPATAYFVENSDSSYGFNLVNIDE